MTLKAALRTFPIIGKRFDHDHVGKKVEMMDSSTTKRLEDNAHPSAGQTYTADRETSALVPSLSRPVTILYPYERLEDTEPWLFVPGNYNGRIGVIWETCTACKACVRICPNDCLHMTTEYRVDILDDAEGEWAGLGGEIEEGGWVATPIESAREHNENRNPILSHDTPSQDWKFGSVLDLTGSSARVAWNDTGDEEAMDLSLLTRAEEEIVSGRIDLGRCMFCGLCMESCNFTSFFMTNEYDGMSGFTRDDLWFDASRTRVLPSEHQEAVDSELAKRATRERSKRERKAGKGGAK